MKEAARADKVKRREMTGSNVEGGKSTKSESSIEGGKSTKSGSSVEGEKSTKSKKTLEELALADLENLEKDGVDEDDVRAVSSPELKVAMTNNKRFYQAGYKIPKMTKKTEKEDSLSESVQRSLLRLSPTSTSNSSRDTDRERLPSDASPLYRSPASHQRPAVTHSSHQPSHHRLVVT